MKSFAEKILLFSLYLILTSSFSNHVLAKDKKCYSCVWEMKEIKLIAEKEYQNHYMEVTCWIELKGPGFSKRVYGFWDGDNNFTFRVVATQTWRMGMEEQFKSKDDGDLIIKPVLLKRLNGLQARKKENPNRNGF
ncbi:MAG: DUF5060 domain-containing protein [Ignavibacteriales bacterium]|nr:DUF5060 domain-containing protein [Ignavibacteriales bacterium]